MMVQRLAPGVQHREGADLGAKVAGVGGDVVQRLRRSAEQDRIHHRFVVEGTNVPEVKLVGRAAEEPAELRLRVYV